jgi:hypothetical protein
VATVALNGGDGGLRARAEESEGESRGRGEAIGPIGTAPASLSRSPARQGGREEAWRLARACAVPPLPTGRG